MREKRKKKMNEEFTDNKSYEQKSIFSYFLSFDLLHTMNMLLLLWNII